MPLVVLLASALSSAALIVLLKPLLRRYALARPNARSSHRTPTPQGGGIAVLSAALLVAGTALAASDSPFRELPIVAAAALLLALVGAVDDIRPLPAAPRLLLQIIAVATVVLASDLRVLSGAIPEWLDKTILILAGVWFVNLVNFMDGIDWITVAEIVPVTAFLAAPRRRRHPARPVALVAAALCGALLGFAPFNKPVARLFLGDVGSLPHRPSRRMAPAQLAATGRLAAARPAAALLSRRRDDHAPAPPRRAASGSGRRIVATSTSRRPTTAFRRIEVSGTCSPSTSPSRLLAGATLAVAAPGSEVAALARRGSRPRRARRSSDVRAAATGVGLAARR